MMINNTIVDNDTLLPDRGYFYGYGVFETLRVINGTIIFLEEHLSRLNKGLMYLGIQKAINEKEVKAAIRALSCDNGVIKINVSEENTVFTTRPLSYGQMHYEEGYRLTLSRVKRNPTSHTVSIKSMNYLDNIIELEKAKKHGFSDALFLNIHNEICETAVANVFIIEGNKIITPEASSGLLRGIMRQWVMNTYPVMEEKLTLSRLLSSEGVFVTNSVMGIMKVIALDEVTLNQHKMVQEIASKYGEVIDGMGRNL
ncbi:4-amino-4-deoxychorismate lyase [Petrocella atlantisensis]|uniref:4-amino-4-deoxychorismate lyase n=1 Tax=Petrocella atlantisensis TaxID=2173034 RepID=A0A3P7RUM6_9FIRM|nr:aminotransferase class IV [Petrocella atlantisensis]VDN46482.1 4-amino-4-deoxychorismate lyase [Petrocella atlantisensis]